MASSAKQASKEPSGVIVAAGHLPPSATKTTRRLRLGLRINGLKTQMTYVIVQPQLHLLTAGTNPHMVASWKPKYIFPALTALLALSGKPLGTGSYEDFLSSHKI